MAGHTNGHSFLDRVVAKTPGGSKLVECLQCGTCGGSCPSAADMDSTPRQLFAMIKENMEEEVLNSNTFWYCISCYFCTERCPMDIPVTDVMYTLKQMAVDKGKYHRESHADFSSDFVGFIEHYGRAFEFGLATRYHLAHHPLTMVKQSAMGLEMFQKGRLKPIPDRIKDLPQLKAILAEAKRIAAEE